MCADALEDEDGFIALVLPVTSYLDASYNWPKGKATNDPRILTIASYTARQKDWSDLRGQWRKVLEIFQVPFFHMNAFEYAKGVATYGTGKISSSSPYYGWEAEKFDRFFGALAEVINSKSYDLPRIHAFTSSIVLSDYEAALPDDLKTHPQCRSAFILNVTNVMNGIALWANVHNYRDPIHYIFAGGDDDSGDLDPFFHRCFKHEETQKHFRLAKGFGRIGYDVQWMKGEPALQMVDCPAYELNRAIVEWAKRDFSPILKTELRASLSILCKIDHFGRTLRTPELLEMFNAIRSVDRRLGFL